MVKVKQLNRPTFALSFIFLFKKLQSTMPECCFARFLPVLKQTHSCQVYCFLGIFPFFYMKFRASEFILLIPIIYNHKILEESNKHAAVGSEV